jgi:serine/threonine protein kinase
MTVRETAAFPPKPAPKLPGSPPPRVAVDSAATMIASSSHTIAAPSPTKAAPLPSSQPSVAATMAAPLPSSQPTLAADGTLDGTLMADSLPAGSGAKTTMSPNTRITVLPDVRSEGDRLVLVPRDQTRYEGDKLLGRGGMGEVKLARDHDIGRKVAVKRLLDDDNPHAVARFIDEVRTVGSLEHPNIVPIHDVGQDEDGAYFFVMKYVEGETLESIIEKLDAGDAAYHKRYGFEARLDLFVGLLRALQYAHSQGLVHRDVKPANIMVGGYGEVVLMDWGIAHRMRSETRVTNLGGQQSVDLGDRASTETVDGSVVGTPQYMSPEQAAGDVANLDGRSDLYSAAVVLYELLTLRPFVKAGQTAMQTVVAVTQRELPSVMEPAYEHPHQTAVPVELRHFLRSALARSKDERFLTAEEMLVTFEGVRSGDFAVSCPITFMKANNTKMGRFMDRHPITSMWVMTVAFIGFLGGLVGWGMWAMT